jgi:hypothetical protein
MKGPKHGRNDRGQIGQQRVHPAAEQHVGHVGIRKRDQKPGGHRNERHAAQPPGEREGDLAEPFVTHKRLSQLGIREMVLPEQPVSEHVLTKAKMAAEIAVAVQERHPIHQRDEECEDQEAQVGKGRTGKSQSAHGASDLGTLVVCGGAATTR